MNRPLGSDPVLGLNRENLYRIYTNPDLSIMYFVTAVFSRRVGSPFSCMVIMYAVVPLYIHDTYIRMTYDA